MTDRQLIARIAGTGSLASIPGIPLLLLVGVVLFLVAVVSSNISGSLPDYWSLVALGWLTALFALAIVGVLTGYWLPRVELFRRGEGPYVPALDNWLLSYVGVLPVVGFTALIIKWDGTSAWPYVLGSISVALGLGAVIDSQLVLRRAASRRQRGGSGG